MKKNLFIFIGCMFLALVLVGCQTGGGGSAPKDAAPVFSGVGDITIERGSEFNPLDGVSATDEEDGALDASLIRVNASAVNRNVEGVYDVIYSVTDSYGNTVFATRKVTVKYTDIQEPVIYGAGAITIVIGNTGFDPKAGVTALDDVEGDVSASIEVSGSIDPWTLGEYKLTYTAEDSLGNDASIERTVTVGLGNFAFLPENALGTAYDGTNLAVPATGLTAPISGISGGIISETLNYGLAKLVLKLNATVATSMSVELTGGTGSAKSIAVEDGEHEYVVYFGISAVLDNVNASIAFAGKESGITIVSAGLYFADDEDSEAPVITITNERVYVPIDFTEELASSYVLKGVSANDNIDGGISSHIEVDFSEVNFAVAGEYVVTLSATDNAGNKGEEEVTLVVAKARDIKYFTDPTFDLGDPDQLVKKGSNGDTTLAIVEGLLVHTTVTAGTWGSAGSPYLSGLTTKKLTMGDYYMFQMDVKADVARKMLIRAGYELWDTPWIEDFAAGQIMYDITTEWATIYYIFYVDKAASAVGSENIKFEIQLGNLTYGSEESNNVVYMDNFMFSKLTNTNNLPVITEQENIKKTFAVNEAHPDFTSYITASDLEDGDITIINSMINEGTFDLATAGEYDIVFTVVDSEGGQSQHTIKVKVVAESDEEGPVIAIDPLAVAFLSSNQPVQGVDLTSAFATIAGYITITDNVDGDIPFAMNMVDLDGLNITSPAAGVYNLVISTKDSSGNDSNELQLQLNVKDAEAPLFVGVGNKTLFVGDTYDALSNVVVVDNLDTNLVLDASNVTGLDQFLVSGVVTTEGDFQVSYTISDAAGNEAVKTVTISVVDPINFEDGTVIDLLSLTSNNWWINKGGSTTTSSQDPETKALTVNYNISTNNWGSDIHAKWNTTVSLTAGKTYKLVMKASAEYARDVMIYFVNSSGTKITGFEGNAADGNKLRVGILDNEYTYEYIFTVDNDSANGSTLEIHFNWDSSYSMPNVKLAQTIVFSEIKFVQEADEVPFEPVVFNDFEGYADDTEYQAATTDNIVGNRIGQSAFVRTNGALMSDGENNYLQQNFAYGTGSTNGLRVAVSAADVPEGAQYLAFYMKASTIENVNAFQAFKYAASHTEITSSLICDLSKLASGTWVYVPVSVLTEGINAIAVMINVKSSASGTLIYDDITWVKEQFVIANEAPVLSISEENQKALAAMTFEVGQDLTSSVAALLGMINATDAEDGNIAVSMSSIKSTSDLNVTNPAMGAYNIVFQVADSEGKLSNELTIKLSVVTIIQDFDECEDYAAALATNLIYGFRVAQSSFVTTNGTLEVSGTNKYLQQNYSTGNNTSFNNGIRINVSYDQLLALGATAVGIFVKGPATDFSAIQIFKYDTTHHQITTYEANINYLTTGAYIYVPLAQFSDANIGSLSIQVQAKNGTTGTLQFDNIVIR